MALTMAAEFGFIKTEIDIVVAIIVVFVGCSIRVDFCASGFSKDERIWRSRTRKG